MDLCSKIADVLITIFALLALATAAPVVQKVEEHPSTYRRVKMAHKFGIVAIDASKRVYLTRNMNDKNTNLVLYAYGPQTHRIQGETSGLSIGMNSRGRVYATTEINTETLFRYNVLPNRRHVFQSSMYKGFYLGFNKQLLPKKGNRARIWKNDRCYFQVFSPNTFSKIKVKSVFYNYFKDSMEG